MTSTPETSPTESRPTDAQPRAAGGVLFPNLYVWFVFVAAMDVILTWAILELGGSEVNPLADWVIQRFGHLGMVVYKLAVTVMVVVICEYIGRRDRPAGLRLAQAAVAISAVPIVWSLILLAVRL